MNESVPENKRLVALGACLLVAAVALSLRWHGEMPPFDDAYHLKRITYSAAHFPRVLDFDPDRGEAGAFCPWPPLYDLAAAPMFRLFGSVDKLPPIFFALFAAAVAASFGRRLAAAFTAGLTIAVSPYLIAISRGGHIDHHFIEPAFVLAIVASVRRPILLGIAISLALLVQPALIVAAGIAFAVIFFSEERSPIGFAIPAVVILIYRLTRPDGYPDSAWFLGYPHAALLAGAAVTLWTAAACRRFLALVAGLAVALSFPQLLSGLRFFFGDPWLRTILEFQPMFSSADRIGTDLANLTGGALLIPLIARRHRTVALFAIVYLLLALSSRRFLVPGIPLFAIAGALAVAEAKNKRMALALAAATLLPPVIHLVATARQPVATYESFRQLALDMQPLPRGRVLTAWSFGHPIDVIGRKPVIVDNFGSMADEETFTRATFVTLTTRPDVLLAYCRTRAVRYLVLPHPAYIPATAAAIGIEARVSGRTVWARLYGGERMEHFTRIRDGAIQVFTVD